MTVEMRTGLVLRLADLAIALETVGEDKLSECLGAIAAFYSDSDQSCFDEVHQFLQNMLETHLWQKLEQLKSSK